MSERFTQKMRDRGVAHDTVVLADFTQIWCDGRHAERARRIVETEVDGIRHLFATRKHRKQAEKSAAVGAAHQEEPR